MGKLSQLGLAAFLAVTSLTGCNKQLVNPNTAEVKRESPEEYIEKLREFARRICNERGYGRHDSIEPDPATGFLPADRVMCLYPQGIYIRGNNFDMPPPAEKLAFEDLPDLIRGKKVMLFGWDHGGGWHEPKNLHFFEESMPILQQEGFTHVGIEHDHTIFQGVVDQFYTDEDETKLRTAFGYYKAEEKYKGVIDDTINMIISAKKHGLKIKCIDARHKDDYPDGKLDWNKRDALMHRNVQNVIADNDNRIAIFIGSGHISYNIEAYVLNGSSSSGMPFMATLKSPLGHRLHKGYGAEEVGSVDLDCDEGERFVDSCIDIDSE